MLQEMDESYDFEKDHLESLINYNDNSDNNDNNDN
jgi:hypothetical protein